MSHVGEVELEGVGTSRHIGEVVQAGQEFQVDYVGQVCSSQHVG